MIFVAVDIGGTFTDLIGFDDEAQAFVQAKSLTTPSELTQGVINCIRESGLDAGKIDELIHGSTTAINTLIERKGAKTGLIVTRGTRDVYNSKHAVKSVADLKGLKIRMMGNPVFVDTMNALGGNGVAMGYDQLVSALQSGVVDGAENNEPSYETGQHYRYAKYYSRTGHLMIPELLVYSKRSWQSLSKDDQALVAKFSREAQQEQRKLWYEMEENSLAKMKAEGVQINDIDDKKSFAAAVKPVWDKYGAQQQALIQRIQDVK